MDQNKNLSQPITQEALFDNVPNRNLFNANVPKHKAAMTESGVYESCSISSDVTASPKRMSFATLLDRQNELGIVPPQHDLTCSNRFPGDIQKMDELNLDDSSVIEFAHLQLKLKSPVQSPAKLKSPPQSPAATRQCEKEVVLDPRLLSRPRIEFADITLRGSSPLILTLSPEPCTPDSDSSSQQFNGTGPIVPTEWAFQPLVLPESSSQHPVTLEHQEMFQPEILNWQEKLGTHIFDPLIRREDTSPKTLATPTTQTVVEQPAHPLDCCSDEEPFSHVFRETAPPTDEFLQSNFTAITLEAGPSVTRPIKSGFVKFPWSIPQISPHYSFLEDSSLPPPPPYSECTQQTSSKHQKLANEERFSSSLPQPHISVIPIRNRPDEDPYRLFNPIYGPKIGGMDDFDPIGYTNFFHPARVGTRTHPPVRSQFETAAQLRRSEPPKSDHQALAFVSCLFCWPIGLVAIYYSNMCHILKSEGEFERAHIYSRLAFIASMAGLGSGIIAYIIMFIYEKAVYL